MLGIGSLILATGMTTFAQSGPPPATTSAVPVQMRSDVDSPPLILIDLPTAQTFRKGHYQIGFRVYQNGGGLASVDIGLSGRLQLGISYGGDNVLSSRSLDGYPRIGFQTRFNLVSQRAAVLPSIAIGFSDQGIGSFSRESDRYTYKSRGFYAVGSWGAVFNGWQSGLHAGINYSLEGHASTTDKIDIFTGFDATLQRELSFLAEYDLALNDRRANDTFNGRGRGYLNAGFRWNFEGHLQIDLIARDILVNRRESKTIAREIRIVYFNTF